MCPICTFKHAEDDESCRLNTWTEMGTPEKAMWVCLKMLCTPLYPMALLIIIPTKWLFHWGYTPFSDIPYIPMLFFFFDVGCVGVGWSISHGEANGAGTPCGRLRAACVRSRLRLGAKVLGTQGGHRIFRRKRWVFFR